jgi:hypothetical protein
VFDSRSGAREQPAIAEVGFGRRIKKFAVVSF